MNPETVVMREFLCGNFNASYEDFQRWLNRRRNNFQMNIAHLQDSGKFTRQKFLSQRQITQRRNAQLWNKLQMMNSQDLAVMLKAA